MRISASGLCQPRHVRRVSVVLHPCTQKVKPFIFLCIFISTLDLKEKLDHSKVPINNRNLRMMLYNLRSISTCWLMTLHHVVDRRLRSVAHGRRLKEEPSFLTGPQIFYNDCLWDTFFISVTIVCPTLRLKISHRQPL